MSYLKESSDEIDRLILKSTYGALLFGVPAHGMDVTAIANIIQDLPNRYVSNLLDRRDGFRLRQAQHVAFCKAFNYRDSKIISFFELEKSKIVVQNPETGKWSRGGSLALLVEPHSASCGRPWENGKGYVISLNGNHSTMVKLPECANDDYNVVCDILQDFIQQARRVIEACLHSPRSTKTSMNLNTITKDQKAALQSLYFSEMHQRKNDIPDAATATCGWILNHQDYSKWFGQKRGLLCVKGKPGAGKSTIMKYALKCAERDDSPYTICASFFFHGRGASIQRNLLGLFRSFLHQMLPAIPEALTEFTSLFKRKCERQGYYEMNWDWHERELQDFFISSTIGAAKTYLIRLYIDALDEVGEEIAVGLASCFQYLSDDIAICLSCRHYPIIFTRKGFEICVEHENSEDIAAYIKSQLKSASIPPVGAEAIQDAIETRSTGNFLWVVLVLKQVLKSFRQGIRLSVIQTQIQELPAELEELYKNLLQGLNEKETSQSLHLLQWVCFAMEPLSLTELRFATAIDADSEYLSIAQNLERAAFADTDEEMEKRVLALSRGLAEIERRQGVAFVLLIHQSVKDYLCAKGFRTLCQRSTEIKLISGHFRLSRSCFRYLAMDEIQCTADKTSISAGAPFEVDDHSKSRLKDALLDRYPL